MFYEALFHYIVKTHLVVQRARGAPLPSNNLLILDLKAVLLARNQTHPWMFVPLAALTPVCLSAASSLTPLLVFLLPDIQTGQGQRNQAKELGKTRPEVHNQQHRTVMMNGTYDVQVSTS